MSMFIAKFRTGYIKNYSKKFRIRLFGGVIKSKLSSNLLMVFVNVLYVFVLVSYDIEYGIMTMTKFYTRIIFALTF